MQKDHTMSSSSLPAEVRQFLYSHIQSVGLLEVLFMFYNHPETKWSSQSMSAELRTNNQSASNQMYYLQRNGFIKQDGVNLYSYNPATEDLRAGVERLHFFYKERPVAVIAFIYEKPGEALKGFADAFKLKKD